MSSFDRYYDKGPLCLAKWHRTNLRLYNGRTYSCHHCVAHQIDPEEIKKDPSSLTNTAYIKQRRQEMLDGKRPDECAYCWEKEDLGEVSDRKLKSQQMIDRMNVVPRETFFDLDAFPISLDVAFENTCNFACSYCGPQNSSKWVDDIKRHGEYKTDYRKTSVENLEKVTILNRDHNPYIEAFWEWWDNGLAENLQRLTITGGEPLLSKNTFRVLERVMQDGHDINININTNLCVPDANWQRFLSVIENLNKNIEVSVSLESTGAQAEYSRHGLEYGKFMQNLETISKFKHVIVNVVTTNNALSYTSMPDFLNEIVKYKKQQPRWKFKMFSNDVRHPSYLDLRVLPKEIREEVAEKLSSVDMPDVMWSDRERTQLQRTIAFSLTEMHDLEKNRKDFANFIRQYDQRRNLDFDTTYPELAEWKNNVL